MDEQRLKRIEYLRHRFGELSRELDHIRQEWNGAHEQRDLGRETDIIRRETELFSEVSEIIKEYSDLVRAR